MTKLAPGEVDDGVGDVLGRPDPPEQRLRRPALLLARLDRDRAGCDAADPHLGRERPREDARQHRLSRLRGASGPRTRATAGTTATSSTITSTPLDCAQRRRDRLGEEERPLRGDVHRRVPVLLGHLLDRLRHEAGARRVDDEVEAAELAQRALDASARAPARVPQVAVGAPGRDDRQPSARSRAAIAVPTRPVPPAIRARLSWSP